MPDLPTVFLPGIDVGYTDANGDSWLDEDTQDELSAILEAAGATDACENPAPLRDWIFVGSPGGTRLDHVTRVALYRDGGDAYALGVIYYREDQPLDGGLFSAWIHLPPAELQSRLAQQGDPGDAALQDSYISGIINDPAAWRPLLEALADTPRTMEPRGGCDADAA